MTGSAEPVVARSHSDWQALSGGQVMDVDSATCPPDRGDLCRSLLDAIDQGFCIVEVKFDAAGRAADYRFIETNPAFVAQTGLPDAVGRWMRDLAPDHEQFWFDRYGEVARNRRAIRFEHSAAALGGRWYQVQAFPVGVPAGHLVGVLFTDIRARKTFEADLHASEARFRAIAELNPDAVLILSRAQIVYANQAAHVLLCGRSCAGLIGRSPRAFLTSDYLAILAPARRRITGQRPVIRQIEQRWRRLDGSEFTAEITAGALTWEGKPAAQVIVRDISERKALEARQRLLSREVDHRAKNVLAVVQALMHLTQADGVADFTRRVEGRIAALARAHRVLASGGWAGADLRFIVEQELAPYGGEETGRCTTAGPSVTLRADAVQPFAMMLHELATNAAKYGALLEPGGQVGIDWKVRDDGSLDLSWRERGGPELAGPPRSLGFGSQLIESTARQLGGSARFAWQAGGLCCDLHVAAGNFDAAPIPPAPPP